MKLGIDFGTTRIVVAAADRGNYPLVSFDATEGGAAEWYPSLAAVRGDQRRFGWDAWASQGQDGWTVIRSMKRLLEDAGPETVLDLGDVQLRLRELLHGLTCGLRHALLESSNLHIEPGERLQAVLGVPAHANSNQRFLTVEAFRSAGFDVLGILNEPSAASIEFGHRQRSAKAGPETMLVYDLGGGTFDASLVALDDDVHHVVASEGIPTIGGDDFDQLLADLALDAAGFSSADRDKIPASDWFALLEECRAKKEALHPNSRRIVIDLEQIHPDWQTVQVPVANFYEAARPLVEETLAATEDLLARHQRTEFDVFYVTGGGSELPLVARVLRERFGRRVRRSAYTRSATAIGLAIQASQPDSYRLSERLSRFFGVWREAEAGTQITFDPLFAKGSHLPSAGQPPLRISRTYSPVHNVGHFRFLECTHRSEDGSPSGEIALWDEVHFPFDPELAGEQSLESTAVQASPDAARHTIEEKYECDSSGCISVTITNKDVGYARTYRLGRWSREARAVAPARRRKKS